MEGDLLSSQEAVDLAVTLSGDLVAATVAGIILGVFVMFTRAN